MRWVVDTSVWSRRDLPEINEQLKEVLGEAPDSELVLSPAVLLELMRGPKKKAVAAERKALTDSMTVLAVDAATFELAADAMESLATYRAEAHRLPIPDLITAALAHQHGCGVLHIDDDFSLISEHSSRNFEQRELAQAPPDGDDAKPHPAKVQRQLKDELAQLLHQMPVSDAESFLQRVVEEARAETGGD